MDKQFNDNGDPILSGNPTQSLEGKGDLAVGSGFNDTPNFECGTQSVEAPKSNTPSHFNDDALTIEH